MARWLKITLGVLAAAVVLLLLNAVVVSNATKDAYIRDDGAQLIDTSAGRLQVLDEGNQHIRPPQKPRPGNPIVLLHGYTESIHWWDRLAPLLERDHRVVRIDLLGHGGSDKPGGGYGIEQQASGIAEALAKLGVLNATVVGESLGAAVATALAERSPRLAARIVVMDEAPDDGFPDEPLGQKMSYWPVIGQALARLSQIAPKSTVRSQYDRAFAPGFNYAEGFTNPDQPVDDLRAMTYTAFKDTNGAEEDFTQERPLDERLAATHLPLLVIFGAEDQIYDAQAAIARYRQVPGAQTHLIPGAGHSPNVERPNDVAPLILAFARPPEVAAKASSKRRPAGKRAEK